MSITPAPSTQERTSSGRLITVAIAMRLVVDTAVRMFYPFLPEISRGLGITLSQGGLLLALRSAMVFPSPLFGAWSDRHGPRSLLTGALLTQALGLWWLSTAQGLVAAIPPIVLLGLALRPSSPPCRRPLPSTCPSFAAAGWWGSSSSVGPSPAW